MPLSEHFEPTSLGEAVALCAKYKDKAKIVGGGTDLVVHVKQGKIKEDVLIGLEKVREINFISHEENGLNIGAMTPVAVIEHSQIIKSRYPILAEAAAKLANPTIRRKATIGGNLCNASPSADMVPALLALGAKVKIVGENGERILELDEFFLGPKKSALAPGEILARVIIPKAAEASRGVYLKSTRSGGADLAVVGVAVVTAMDGKIVKDIKIGLGAVAPTPIRARQTESLLKGKELSESLLDEICLNTSNEACCISDVRCTAEYRDRLIGILVKRAIRQTAGLAN